MARRVGSRPLAALFLVNEPVYSSYILQRFVDNHNTPDIKFPTPLTCFCVTSPRALGRIKFKDRYSNSNYDLQLGNPVGNPGIGDDDLNCCGQCSS
ncbi:hypothetical protein TNCT_534571 [Trichonephila clavata]|uniref:Uncharacterized protein n=1 Tax=Trichonephila clavata TaxID=2740835 RepID=A0A8X6L7D2_TRICU|nr:hypothetical protein TNCT_534571 [Trichonephila clavata]